MSYFATKNVLFRHRFPVLFLLPRFTTLQNGFRGDLSRLRHRESRFVVHWQCNIVHDILPTIFFVNKKTENELQKEMKRFNDFIIGDFIDSYRNITLKTFSAYKYFSEYCSNNENRVILIHDDDILMNEINFSSFLVNNLGKQG